MAGDGAQLLDHWLRAITDTPRDQLAGIILDNRCNNGGFQDDLDYLIGSFIKQPVEVMQTRYKEGPGRLEYSQWVPNLNYGGPFGDGANLRGHYIYTSTFEALIGGRVTEGIGHTLDKIVLRKDHNGSFAPQLDAALNYIANY